MQIEQITETAPKLSTMQTMVKLTTREGFSRELLWKGRLPPTIYVPRRVHYEFRASSDDVRMAGRAFNDFRFEQDVDIQNFYRER